MKAFLRVRDYIQNKAADPQSQRRMILVIVCVALLLDNMLYMVIVPIIPHYLSDIAAFNNSEHKWSNGSVITTWPVQRSHDVLVGLLFASKAIVQLLINPLSGMVIDRIGYDKPMMFGLGIIFLSTGLFAFGRDYATLFLARSLQGVGSAFADTSGLAMITDRYTEDQERTTALGIALAFISFGSLVAPPFGGVLYNFAGKVVPFLCLAFLALLDGFLLLIVMKPTRLERRQQRADGNLLKGTSMRVLFADKDILLCAGALALANVSLAFLEPTLADWMEKTMSNIQPWQLGLVWLPAFFPHIAGVYTTVKLSGRYPHYQWLIVAIGISLEGYSCLFLPICHNFITVMLPICFICYGIALVDTAVLPTLAYVMDTRYVSVYGTVYAIADISYSLAYAIGPIVAGSLVTSIGFTGLNFIIFLSNVLYAPLLYQLKDVHRYHLISTTPTPSIPSTPNLQNQHHQEKADLEDAQTEAIENKFRIKEYSLNGRGQLGTIDTKYADH